ncbi:MAG: N-6 DNA methylase [Candidatus Aenigmatarchaeota archaeon]
MGTNENYTSEEDVKFKFIVPFLEEKGYSKELMDFDKSIKIHEGRKEKTIFADLVVYIDKNKDSPVILVETKAPSEALKKSHVEQAISYARLLPKIAPLVVLSNSIQTRVYQSVTKNRIESLPKKDDLSKDIVDLIISKEIQKSLRKEAVHELFIIDDVKTFRNVLKQCHNTIRNNEGYDPTQAFDEMSKILFCKMYEEKYHPKKNRFTLDVFKKTEDELELNIIQKIYQETIEHPRYKEIFPEDDTINLKDRTIKKIVKLFENYDLSLTAFDVKGEAFEYFLSDTFTGGLGEYFTPRNVVEFMVDVINPKIGEKIVDPFCGTGGFLIYAFDVVSEKIRLQDFSEEEKEKWREELSSRCLYGTDWKERTIQACKMNMIVHGDGHTGIFLGHGLENIEDEIKNKRFDICLTNPPFGSSETDSDILKKFTLGKNRDSQEREVLAIERAIRLIKPEYGRAGIVVIEGILNTQRYEYVRNYIKKHVWIDAIISLNYDTFAGYGAKATTSLLFFRRKKKPDNGKQNDIFMAVCENTGYSPSGLEIPGNELPEIFLQYKKFKDDGITEFDNNRIFVVSNDELKDRLDPQHYLSTVQKVQTDISEVTNTRNKLQNQYKELKDSYGSLLNISIVDFNDIDEWETVKVNDLVKEYREKEELKSDKEYTLVGVSGDAQGAFLKDPIKGDEIKTKKRFKTKQGVLIYNRLFAHRASFDVLEDEVYNNCYVSGEFPQFEARETKYDKKSVIKYLFYYCISPVFIDRVRRYSSGSTKQSRFRFNQKYFKKFDVKIPKNPEDLDRIVEKLDAIFETAKKINELQEILSETIDKLKEKYLMTLP